MREKVPCAGLLVLVYGLLVTTTSGAVEVTYPNRSALTLHPAVSRPVGDTAMQEMLFKGKLLGRVRERVKKRVKDRIKDDVKESAKDQLKDTTKQRVYSSIRSNLAEPDASSASSTTDHLRAVTATVGVLQANKTESHTAVIGDVRFSGGGNITGVQTDSSNKTSAVSVAYLEQELAALKAENQRLQAEIDALKKH